MYIYLQNQKKRVFLQNFFFPPLYRNTKQTKKLNPGDTRVHTKLKILIQFDCPLTFKVPFKETSKVFFFLILHYIITFHYYITLPKHIQHSDTIITHYLNMFDIFILFYLNSTFIYLTFIYLIFYS